MMTLCQKRRPRGKPAHRLSKRRLMHSTGHNIINVGVSEKHWKYLSDLYTTLIDIKWRWNILIFVSGFVLSWLAFACFYYLLGYMHGDMDEHEDTDFIPCMENVKTFTAAFLFSIETMTTIGYGFRSQTESCPGVYLAVMLQSIIGAGLQFMLASIVVSKTRRAKRRSETILFSDRVCIYEQDSKLQLAIRIGDMRKSEIVGAHAQGYLVKKYKSKDGTFVPVRFYQVPFKGESGKDEIFFPWPTQILHKVDEDSPVWSLSRDELLNGKYELIVVIDGISGATSRPFQARKSYHTFEMKWGHRFVDLNLEFNSSGGFSMDLDNFHHTVLTSTPLCSAQDITHLRQMYRSNQEKTGCSGSDTPTTSQSNIATPCSISSDNLANNQPGKSSKVQSEEPHVLKSHRAHRSHSLEETTRKRASEFDRRCSLGDMIRVAQGGSLGKKNLLGDALNIYRHRRSVTDTYLGAEIEEEAEEDYDSSQAILSVVSQRSADRRTDVRDIFKRRRSSVQLCFGNESTGAGDAEGNEGGSHGLLTAMSQKSPDKQLDVRDLFKRRRSSMQLMLGPEPSSTVTQTLVEEHEK